ncbi:MAG: hypothetical protein WBC93_07080 [Sulfitobacter sp.]
MEKYIPRPDTGEPGAWLTLEYRAFQASVPLAKATTHGTVLECAMTLRHESQGILTFAKKAGGDQASSTNI